MPWPRRATGSTSSCSMPAATTRSTRAPRADCRASTPMRACSCPIRPRRARWRSTAKARNSPYTKYLATSITTPNLNIEETFKRTLKGVYQETKGGRSPGSHRPFLAISSSDRRMQPRLHPMRRRLGSPQEPWSGRYPFRCGQAKNAELAGIYRANGTNPNGSQYRAWWREPKERRVRAHWWIGKQVFHGTGHFAGKMLVVNWGAKHPVIHVIARRRARRRMGRTARRPRRYSP